MERQVLNPSISKDRRNDKVAERSNKTGKEVNVNIECAMSNS